jgi:hypothetical protein
MRRPRCPLNTRSSVDRAKQTFIDLNTDFHCAALPDGLMYIYQITTTAGNVKRAVIGSKKVRFRKCNITSQSGSSPEAVLRAREFAVQRHRRTRVSF